DFSHLLENLVRDHVRRHPLLIHFDDFDRASRAVRRLAMELVHVAGDRSSDRDGPCRLLIVISRQSKNGAGHLALSEIPVLELRPFTDEESREFLEHVFGQQAVPPAVAETFQSLARGNPLFLVELANHLVEQGRVVFTGAQWKFPESLQGLSLPSSLSGLFSRKIESLQGSLLDILNWVAVSGRPLARGVIVRSADLSPERVDSLLKELTDRSLLTRFEMKDGVERYELSYGGSREILCGRIEEGERRRLHQRLAQNTEEEFPGRDDLADELADHWLKAGNEPGFLRFAPKAADLLQARGDFETAVSYRRRIAESMPPTAIAKKIQSLARLSEMHEFLWDLDACQRDLEAIRDLGQSLLKPSDRALLLRRMAGVELARFEFGKAAALLEEAARLASGSAPVCRLAIDAPRAQSIWFTSGPEKASPLLESTERSLFALPPPEAERDKMLWISSASQLAGLRHQTGDLPRARDLYGKALEMLRKMQQPQAAAATECGLGSVLLDAGEYEEALMHLQAALATARRIGDRRTICRARERLGEYCMRFARLGEAFQITQISLEEAEMMHNRAAAASSLRTLGRLYGHAGDDASAFVALRRAARSSHEQGDILGFGLGSVQLARHFLGQGEAIRARHQIEETARELQRFRLPLLEAHCALCLYAGAWKELRRKRDDLAAEARAVFDRHGYRSDLVDAILIQCEVEIEAGEIDRATTLLEELRSLTRDHARPHVACEAMFLLGRLRAEMKDARGASAFFIKARNLARDQHKHRLALRAQEEAKAILLAV
ncbi:MAG: tetratricopeptide repeat protein, partial [Planctomycetes bacterium]|nr:tetratricopeptide repeat protein [Planctomycetota bacterium]